jgi:metal-dependent HD superfamily phosphatase/phosphodiesterase
MITLDDVKKNPQILEFINQTEEAMEALSYTNHGLRHSEIVSDRAMQISKAIGLDERESELAGIAGFCHDMGNFMTRTFHHFFGAMLFGQVFSNQFDPKELAMIMQAISNHDKEEMNFTHHISAILVLADKSDVDRSRVTAKDPEHFKNDIHDRVNYAAQESMLKVNKAKKKITLTLKIDTHVCPVIEYFEIFTERMVFCRKAAQFLGYDFGLVINNFRLL